MLQRTRSFLVLSLALATIAPLLLSTPSTAQTQYKRVYLEEFTGAWCGFCVRGAYAIDNLYKSYPGQVIAVSFHSDQGSLVNDQMDIPQGDSLISDIGFPPAEALQGFPDGWTARTVQGATWNVDPSAWATGVAAQFGLGGSDGIVGQLLASDPVNATVTVDNITFDNTTKQVTARVSVKFAAAASGDLRLNLMVTEDSVTGTGSGWDQHNYYSKTGGVGASVPNNPLYNYAPSIAGWKHMHVFREAVGGVLGLAGIIPSTVSAGGTYSTTFTFTLPSNIQNPNHVHLIGLVNQYSATDASGNEVLDADEVPLVGPAPKYFITQLSLTPDNPYASAKSGGSTPSTISIVNNGTDPVTLSLAIDPTTPLPTGWSASVTPSITIAAGASQTATVSVTAPEQSAYVTVNVIATPVKEGYLVATYHSSVNFLSDNTTYGIYETAGFLPSPQILAGLPDTVKLHTASIPLDPNVTTAFPIENMSAAIFDNDPVIGGSFLIPPNSVSAIESILSAGGKVFFSSADAMALQYYTGDSRYTYASSSDADDFFLNTLGLSYRTTELRYNTSSGAYTSFTLKGTTDPIGNGVPSVTLLGSEYSAPFDIVAIADGSTPSVPLFYFDNKTTYNAGVRYTDPVSGGKMVYLGFDLTKLTAASSKWADTIAARSLTWLFSSGSAAVNQPAAIVAGISAAPNPFHGMTQIQYVAGQGEHGVSLAAYDLLGREVARLTTQSAGGSVYTAMFDGSKLTNGTYVIVAHSSTGTHEVRVVNQQ